MPTINPNLIKFNKSDDLLNNFYTFWETADPNLLEKSVSKNLKDYDRAPGGSGSDYDATLAMAQSFGGLSNMNHTLQQVHYLDDGKMVVRWECTAKHTGDVMGFPATQKEVAFFGHDIFQVVDGKITELWHIEGLLQLTAQLK